MTTYVFPCAQFPPTSQNCAGLSVSLLMYIATSNLRVVDGNMDRVKWDYWAISINRYIESEKDAA